MTEAGEALYRMWISHHDVVAAYEEVRPVVEAYDKAALAGIKFVVNHPELTTEDVHEAMDQIAEDFGDDDPFVQKMREARDFTIAAKAEDNAENN